MWSSLSIQGVRQQVRQILRDDSGIIENDEITFAILFFNY